MDPNIKEYIAKMKMRYENPVPILQTKQPVTVNPTTPTPTQTTKSKKRTYEESFGPHEYDIERYGQEIDENFFQTHVGHAVK